MKKKSSIKKTFYLLICILSSLSNLSQNKSITFKDVFGQRVFIKNNGQFDKIIPSNKIEYAYVKDDEQVYFTNKGLTYLVQKKFPLTHSQFEAIEHGEKPKIKEPKKCFVNVSWENSNPNATLEVSDKQSYYQSYGDIGLQSQCYKKLTYKNIYNNIDIEYLFTNEKENGIKYNIILHPGANINDVKINYSGDIKKIYLKKGNVIIKTSLINITELAPISFQNGLNLTSNFVVKNNVISFSLPNGYDTTKELTIDPWIINLTLANNNYAYDVDYDYAGNYFVYGGSGPFIVAKYSFNGILLWIFNGSVPSINWGTAIYPSNFVVDKLNGKCYIGQGLHLNGTRVVRINELGLYDNFVSIAFPTWREIWDMTFRCSDNAIIAFGGSTASNKSAGILNTSNGIITPQNFTGITVFTQDIISHAIDSNGNIFIIYGNILNSVNNHILKINNSFNGNDWFTPSNYNTFGETNNKSYPGYNNTALTSLGFNALAANNEYLYYYDGYNLAAYNKANGIQIGSIQLTGQNSGEQGGISVDNCNNIYVGGIGIIKCFNFNGTTFTANGNIPVDTTTTNKYITDIKLNPNTQQLYVCGNGFGGLYSAINSLSCTTSASLNVVQNGTSATATVTTTISSPIINYIWLNSNNVIINQTNNSTSLSNTVNSLIDGTYTVLIQLNGPCGVTASQIILVNNINIIPTFNSIAPICIGTNLLPLPITSNNNISGSWSPALNNAQTTTYTFTPDIGQNSTTATLTITVNPNIIPVFNSIAPFCESTLAPILPTNSLNNIPGTWNPPLINNTNSGSYTFTPSSTPEFCWLPTTINVSIIPSEIPLFSPINPICFNDLAPILPGISLNNIPGTWNPQLISNINSGSYTFTPSSTSGFCWLSTTINVSIIPREIPIFSPISPICFNDLAPILPTTSLNGYTGTWSPAIISNTKTGNYQFTPDANQCTILPTPINISVNDDFDFIIEKICINKKFILQIIPTNNTFDVNTANIIWQNNSNTIVESNNSSLNITDYLISNSIQFHAPLEINATVTLPNGCYKTHEISINKIYCDIQKGISPNSDNLNDYFDLELLDVKNLEIFNRYGVKVFSKNNYTTEWIGQSDSGKELPDGVYYYVIEFNSDNQSATGWIYINREIK